MRLQDHKFGREATKFVYWSNMHIGFVDALLDECLKAG